MAIPNQIPHQHTAKCQAKDSDGESICSREVFDETARLCIFHAADKPVDAFKTHLLAELKRVNETEGLDKLDGRFFVFPGDISLSEFTFEKSVDFFQANFMERGDFSGSIFKKAAYFIDVTFGSAAVFKYAQFGAEAIFKSTKFRTVASFERAQFNAATIFQDTEFGVAEDFKGAKSKTAANFVRATFNALVDFGHARFHAKADFAYTQFRALANFVANVFSATADFRGARFDSEVIIRCVFDQEAVFYKVRFSHPNLVSFDGVDLSRMHFSGSDISDVYFSIDCTWPTDNGRLAVYDEIAHLDTYGPETIEQIYLRLQKNFENGKRFDKAGDFYIGAMEMRRVQARRNRQLGWHLLLSLYSLMSRYGERFARTLLWMGVVMVFLFPAFYLLAGFKVAASTKNGSVVNYAVNYEVAWALDFPPKETIAKALIVSIHAFTFQRNMPYALTVESELISIAESAISATLLALFLLALRRRFRR